MQFEVDSRAPYSPRPFFVHVRAPATRRASFPILPSCEPLAITHAFAVKCACRSAAMSASAERDHADWPGRLTFGSLYLMLGLLPTFFWLDGADPFQLPKVL